MCAGLCFQDKENPEKIYKIFFPIPLVKIPIISKKGIEQFVYWGRRNQKEFPETNLPITGWAKIESIKKGWWHQYNPEKVYIPAIKFMEKDKYKKSHWFDVEKDKFIIGLKIKWKDFHVCYIVTKPTPKEFLHIHNRWVIMKKFGD